MKKYIDYLRWFIGFGSGGSGGSGFMPAGTININKNGQYKVTQYTDANVDVPNPSHGTLSIGENGTYDVTTKATAEVYVPPYGTGTKTIKRNNAKEDVDTYKTANVQVQGGDDGTTSMPVTCPSGYTEIRTTETLLESTVNNWKVGSRTPALRCGADVTVAKGDKVGYIGIKQGTAYEFCVYGTVYSVSSYTSYKRVTITIEGIVHGDSPTLNITENGTYNVKGRNSAVVNVSSGFTQEDEGKVVQNLALVSQTSKTVTKNGTYTTTTNNEVVVNVPAPYVSYDFSTMIFSTPAKGSTIDITFSNGADLSVGTKVAVACYGYGEPGVVYAIFGTVKTVKTRYEVYEIQVAEVIREAN